MEGKTRGILGQVVGPLCAREGSFNFGRDRELFFFVFLGPHLQLMEVPRLGVELELQLPAFDTATATRDPNYVCDLHHSSWQRRILNTLSEARD